MSLNSLLTLLTLLSALAGCATPTAAPTSTPRPKSTEAISETETYFAVLPTTKTRVLTFHVQTEKFSLALAAEFEQALTGLAGKCWYWAIPSYKEAFASDGPDYCLKFVKFTEADPLKTNTREAQNKKMLLTSLGEDHGLRIQNFVWDGAKLQRVRNSNSRLPPAQSQQDRFTEFVVRWALK